MSNEKRKILILVEGEKLDVNLMNHLMKIYNIDAKYEIVPYKTNIYTLYEEMFFDGHPELVDLIQVLISREKSEERRIIFDDVFSDILLIFDLDPQAPDYHEDKISKMLLYFVESSDMGKLYINYPMVESFYHMKSIPDEEYINYYASMSELRLGKYKQRVNRENRNHDYRKFAINRTECNYVIKKNLEKGIALVEDYKTFDNIPSQIEIFNAQSILIEKEEKVLIISTCGFFIYEYNPSLLD